MVVIPLRQSVPEVVILDRTLSRCRRAAARPRPASPPHSCKMSELTGTVIHVVEDGYRGPEVGCLSQCTLLAHHE